MPCAAAPMDAVRAAAVFAPLPTIGAVRASVGNAVLPFILVDQNNARAAAPARFSGARRAAAGLRADDVVLPDVDDGVGRRAESQQRLI